MRGDATMFYHVDGDIYEGEWKDDKAQDSDTVCVHIYYRCTHVHAWVHVNPLQSNMYACVYVHLHEHALQAYAYAYTYTYTMCACTPIAHEYVCKHMYYKHTPMHAYAHV